MYGKTLAYLSKCGMIAKANIAAFVVKNCKERENYEQAESGGYFWRTVL